MKKFLFPILYVALPLLVKAQDGRKTKLPQPKLVVGIVVDQMRYDYLYRFYNKYSEGGFKRMLNEGFNCRNNHYHYAHTVTAAGHAAVYTGSLPAINGMIGNEWYDPFSHKGVYCVEDSTVKTVGSTNAGVGKMSPRNLLVSTVTDQLRIATQFRSKTIGIAVKDRGSILPAGHAASGAYWYDSKTGNWVTSTYYRPDLPQWVSELNARKLPAEYAKQGWKTLLPIDQYSESTPDDQPYEAKLSGSAKPVFPYELMAQAGDAFGAVLSSPGGNTMTKDMAIAAIKGENLGKGEAADFLAISFSTPDRIGHAFGPNSVEEEDIYLRLDLEFANLFSFLDSWTGKGNYTVFLTADHGVMDVPGFWKQHNLPAGLLSGKKVNDAINKALTDAFGTDDYVEAFENAQLYLNRSVLAKKKLTVDAVHTVVRDALLPMPGIADVLNLKSMSTSNLNSHILELYKNMTHAKRSGDIQLIPEPGWIENGGTGTNHGSPYHYDTHVPFVLFGWGVTKGETLRYTTIADIAPTIANLLHILPPSGTVGNAVHEALK
ncbi:alkaline phosphatase family protein [Spirosoma sp. BT702]|uniref:Alkaline phosphatase family protein n=1 Tax=Spirosoma profusum TaxID=2771354 RepID=A0A927APW7_9BACT|nr:alkaline phosphatase PafA [Spirosoma profusum]MBD2699193.1 alkaline phosphatase family protein [Spirosoma profusum]